MNASGKIPSERDKLIMFVMGVMSMSMHSFTKEVGQGSSSQDLVGEEEISFHTFPGKLERMREGWVVYEWVSFAHRYI